MSSPAALRVSLFGAPGTNGNLGLDALLRGTLAALREHVPDAHVSVFDHALGVRPAPPGVGDERLAVSYVGARRSRRVTRPESFAAMRASLLVGGRRNPGARAVLDSSLVLDVSGGDSFSDAYGVHRFRAVCAPKALARAARRPLVLLPQTYGPFADPRAAAQARRLVLGAEQAWARDPDSLAALAALLGDDLDPERHRGGVDLAVLLDPAPSLPAETAAVVDRRPRPVGINVSGLLWRSGAALGLRADYRSAVTALVSALVRRGAPVLLVPHVLPDRSVSGDEADTAAAQELHAGLPADVRGEVDVVPGLRDAAQAKAVIARCDWFAGARMHATVAALSSGVPSVALAYSGKFRGVFETLGAAGAVLDARALDTGSLVDAALEAYERRDDAREPVRASAAAARTRAREQMAIVLRAAEPPRG